MSQIKSFTYTKANKEVSARTVLVISEPSNMLTATDISELSYEDQVDYARTISRIHDEYLNAIAQANADFDVNNRVRKFDPLKMTEVSYEWIGV